MYGDFIECNSQQRSTEYRARVLYIKYVGFCNKQTNKLNYRYRGTQGSLGPENVKFEKQF